jgi:hypothetical protein
MRADEILISADSDVDRPSDRAYIAQMIRLGTAPGRLSNRVADHIGGSAARG